MTDMTILNRMIKDTAKIPLEDNYSRKKVVLIEHGTMGSSLEIHNLPDDAMVIDIDGSFSNEKLFSGDARECKRGDYLIISEQERIALFIEMKKGNPVTGDIIKQLKGSQCVFEYCQSIACKFFDEASFLADYKLRFVMFKNVNLDKRKTKIDRDAEIHNTPETLMKVSWAKSIQFNRIAA